MKTLREMEFEEAPSGYVKLYNYKEPFMKFGKGYGFQGALLFDGETDKVQCHFCGEWFISLPQHIGKEHNMKASEYKKEVGLSNTTALISESMREKLIASGLNKRLQNLRSRKGVKHTKESKDKIRAALKENRRELQNLRGTCPEQLIDRLLKDFHKNGDKTPSSKEIVYEKTLVKTFGSYTNACRYAGIPVNEPLEKLKEIQNKRRYLADKRSETVFNWMKGFYLSEGKLPSRSDFGKSDYNFLFRRKLIDGYNRRIIIENGYKRHQKVEGIRFSKEELLEILRKFKELNQRMPSYSDARRGLIPHLSRYSYHFGSWKNTLKLAFN